MSRLDAIDVARYQLDVDWNAAHAATAGHLVAWKATQGSSYVDPKFARNRAETARVGYTHRLMYHWVSPKVAPAAQARHVLHTVGTLARGEGIMLDVEEVGVTADIAATVAELIEAQTKRPVAVYTGAYVDGGKVWRSPRLFDGTRPRILAAYVSEKRAALAAFPHRWDMWQWTSTATVPGVPTRVDGNRVDNLAAFDPVCGLTPEGPDDMEYVLIDVDESNVLLIGKRDRNGLILEAEWTGPGSDSKVQARLSWLRSKGTPTITFPIASLAYVTLVGPLPHDDPGQDWHEGMFFRVIG